MCVGGERGERKDCGGKWSKKWKRGRKCNFPLIIMSVY